MNNIVFWGGNNEISVNIYTAIDWFREELDYVKNIFVISHFNKLEFEWEINWQLRNEIKINIL